MFAQYARRQATRNSDAVSRRDQASLQPLRAGARLHGLGEPAEPVPALRGRHARAPTDLEPGRGAALAAVCGPVPLGRRVKRAGHDPHPLAVVRIRACPVRLEASWRHALGAAQQPLQREPAPHRGLSADRCGTRRRIHARAVHLRTQGAGAEREHPDLVMVVWPTDLARDWRKGDDRVFPLFLDPILVGQMTKQRWYGKANRLSPDDPVPWEIIDAVAVASRKHSSEWHGLDWVDPPQ